MSRPTPFPPISYTRGYGNSAPINLLHNLPPEEDAVALMLASGDPRSILFTIHTALSTDTQDGDSVLTKSSNLQLDVTCCDHDASTIARNILLLTMLADDVVGTQTDLIWNFFYHIYIDRETQNFLGDQCRKLLAVGVTCKEWSRSNYGSFIRFCDSRRSLKMFNEGFEMWSPKKLQLSTLLHHSLGMFASDAVTPEEWQGPSHYWNTGICFTDRKMLREAVLPNPTFAHSIMGTRINLNVTNDPLAGYPLQRLTVSKNPPLELLRHWGHAFRIAIETRSSSKAKIDRDKPQLSRSGSVMIRYICADALAYCRGLLYYSVTNNVETPYYSRFGSFDTLTFDVGEYPKEPKSSDAYSAPIVFNVIETSSIADIVGSLNLLMVTVPLLQKTTPNSTLHTEFDSLLNDERAHTQLKMKLLSDVSTVAAVLGVAPTFYASGFSTISCTHEMFVASQNAYIEAMANIGDYERTRERIEWKFVANGDPFACTVDPDVCKRHLNADIGTALKYFLELESLSLRDINYLFSARYTADSFAQMLIHLRTRFPDIRNDLVSEVLDHYSKSLVSGRCVHFIEEKLSRLVANGIIPENSLSLIPGRPFDFKKDLCHRLDGWLHVPRLLSFTFIIPHASIRQIFDVNPSIFKKIERFAVEIHVVSLRDGETSIFNCGHYCFGSATLKGINEAANLHVVETDPDAWSRSDLIFSTIMPSSLLCKPELQFNIMRRREHEIEVDHSDTVLLFTTTAGNRDHLILTVNRPNLTNELSRLGKNNTFNSDSSPASAPVSSSPFKIGKITFERRYRNYIDRFLMGDAALQFQVTVFVTDQSLARKLRKRNAEVKTSWKSPCSLSLRVENDEVDVAFPLPVDMRNCTVSIARKSSYITILVGVLSRLTPCDDKDTIPRFPFMQVQSGHPGVWSLHRTNLDSCPPLLRHSTLPLFAHNVLDTVTLQLSERERCFIKAFGLKAHLEPLRSLKELLVIMFKEVIRAKKDHIAIGFTGRDNLAHTVIFVNNIRIDTIANAPVLDCCVLLLNTKVRKITGFREDILDGLYSLPENYGWGFSLLRDYLLACVERCRTDWSHDPSRCEFIRAGSVEDSSPLCSCSIGHASPCFLKVSKWKRFSKYVSRAGLCPLFTPGFMETFSDRLKRMLKRHMQMVDDRDRRTTGFLRPMVANSFMRDIIGTGFRICPRTFTLRYHKDMTEGDIDRMVFWVGLRGDVRKKYMEEWRSRKKNQKWDAGTGTPQDPYRLYVDVNL
ncbi:hypothetical protein BC829DRAFT_400724 [Chytridium lagenaria]|nr:hypothetical protein BC829DRAFT_400724 [Chytridium lagenaria]